MSTQDQATTQDSSLSAASLDPVELAALHYHDDNALHNRINI